MDPAALRAEFPVLERVAYLNAGTDGPLPAAAVRFARGRARGASSTEGRATAHFERRFALQAALRAGYARVHGLRGRGRRADDLDERGHRRGDGRDGPRARATRSSPPTRSTRA